MTFSPVDLLFESDIGFWQSLTNLAQNAKCPIILTASAMPPQLEGSTNVRSGDLVKPSPMECASKMCQVARMENMSWKRGLKDRQIKEGLSVIARMCCCDLRKIMHEMQSFNNCQGCIKENRHQGCNDINKTMIDAGDESKFVNKQCGNSEDIGTNLESQTQCRMKNMIEVQNLLRVAELSSDAALLEEGLGVLSIPSLAGAVQRCGEMETDSAFDSILHKDDDFFFGGPDTFVTRPFSRREMYLYSMTSEVSRRMAPFHPEIIRTNLSVSNSDDNDTDFFFAHCITDSISEEDQFLSCPSNSCAEMVPQIVRSSHSIEGCIFQYISQDKQSLLYQRERDFQCSILWGLADTLLSDLIVK